MPPASSPNDDISILTFEAPEEFAAWLAANHAASPAVWIKFAKKNSGCVSLSYEQAVETALAWGWIDGQSKPFDDKWWLQRFSRRRRRSPWSKINRERAERLIAAGRFEAPGLEEVKRAKQDGRWERAYDSPSRATVPDDLAAALQESPSAAKAFENLDGRNRFAFLYRIQTAIKPETRARRIAEAVKMLARGEKLHP